MSSDEDVPLAQLVQKPDTKEASVITTTEAAEPKVKKEHKSKKEHKQHKVHKSKEEKKEKKHKHRSAEGEERSSKKEKKHKKHRKHERRDADSDVHEPAADVGSESRLSGKKSKRRESVADTAGLLSDDEREYAFDEEDDLEDALTTDDSGSDGKKKMIQPRKLERDAARKSAAPRRESVAVPKKTLELKLSDSGAREIDTSKPLKEQVVEAILIRWNYSGLQYAHNPSIAFTDVGTPATAAALDGHTALLGFPGVFVGLRDDVLGTVLDRRPTAPRPSKGYLMSLPSEQLVELWRTAVTNQRRDLVTLHGDFAPLAKLLKEELRSIDRFDVEKSDRQFKSSSRDTVATAGIATSTLRSGTKPVASSAGLCLHDAEEGDIALGGLVAAKHAGV